MSGVVCASCGSANEAGRKFCGECGASLAVACAACGTPNPPTVKFCGECGTSLVTISYKESPGGSGGPAPSATAPAAERRLVSVLFADLVGFTAASEGRDAEDTRELLTCYFDTARTVIERYGGTVEKFIGDAVMAVWGAPVAQEDDAERAVRAALDLVAAIPELDGALQARAGVLTGEAAVTVGAEGQGMVAGDLVNTAARIQSAAEPGTVLVGEATRRASGAAIAYENTGEHDLKGKAEAVTLHRALRVVTKVGGEGRAAGLEAPFVGRDRELRLVRELFHATADDRRATLVSAVGVAGIGKSRLSWEFEKYADGLSEVIWWHRGRCLAYGDGVAYWALAEMIRSRAGIVEGDEESVAREKLRAQVDEHVADPRERDWMLPRLEHLLGLGERGSYERDDLYSAWRTFFERLADTGTVALVLEGLHWADQGLIAFVEHLLDCSRSRPIFVLTLARPELSERHPGFGASARSSTTLVLEPLDDEAMDDLLDGLVPGLPDDVRATVRERADGIPLYAVETVRMLIDQGLVARDGDSYAVVGSIDAVAVPDTLHALIAARLDGLDPGERSVLQRAAVLGKSFTAAGVAALGQADVAATEVVLAALARKEVLAVDADPFSPERGQFGFLQALVQRVAYETLSRHERRRLHVAAATYLAGSVPEPDELAEIIAAHYRDANAADPDAEGASETVAQAREWLRRAGERAAALAAPAEARRAFAEAAALADEPLEQAALLQHAGELAFDANELELSREHLEQARALFASVGRDDLGARAAFALSRALTHLDRADEALALVESTLATLVTDEHDEHVARLAAEAARVHYFAGDLDTALERVELALQIAESQRLPAILSDALNTKSLLYRGRFHEAHALLREALAVALEHDLVHEALRAYNNLSVILEAADRTVELRAVNEAALQLARQRGSRFWADAFGMQQCFDAIVEARWDDVFSIAEEVLPEAPDPFATANHVRIHLAWLAFERRDEAEARRQLDLVWPEIETSTDRQLQLNHPLQQAVTALIEDRSDDAVAGCRSYIDGVLDHDFSLTWIGLPLGLAARSLQLAQASFAPLVELVRRVETTPESLRPRELTSALACARALVAAEQGQPDEAVDQFGVALAAARSADNLWILASVLADYGLALVADGRADEAAPLLAEARGLFERMGAVRWLEQIDAAIPALASHTGV